MSCLKGNFYKYNHKLRGEVVLNSDNFKAFKREYNIDLLCSDEPEEVLNSPHIAYLRYQNSLHKFVYNRNQKLLEYLKKGTPVKIGNNIDGVVDKVHDGLVDVYLHLHKKIKKNVKPSSIQLRKKKGNIGNIKLNPYLDKKSTKELLRMKNKFHWYSYDDTVQCYKGNDGTMFSKNDLYNILRTREHVDRKRI